MVPTRIARSLKFKREGVDEGGSGSVANVVSQYKW